MTFSRPAEPEYKPRFVGTLDREALLRGISDAALNKLADDAEVHGLEKAAAKIRRELAQRAIDRDREAIVEATPHTD